jgi:hypothetical protein
MLLSPLGSNTDRGAAEQRRVVQYSGESCFPRVNAALACSIQPVVILFLHLACVKSLGLCRGWEWLKAAEVGRSHPADPFAVRQWAGGRLLAASPCWTRSCNSASGASPAWQPGFWVLFVCCQDRQAEFCGFPGGCQARDHRRK